MADALADKYQMDYESNGAQGPGDIVDAKIGQMLSKIGSKAKRTLGQVLASGFGKGAVVAALVFVAALAIAGAAMGGGVGGALAVGNGTSMIPVTSMAQGLEAGVIKAFQILFSSTGAALVVTGGVMGMGMEYVGDLKQRSEEDQRVLQEKLRTREIVDLTLKRERAQAQQSAAQDDPAKRDAASSSPLNDPAKLSTPPLSHRRSGNPPSQGTGHGR